MANNCAMPVRCLLPMLISDARFELGRLILTASHEARKFVYNFKPGEYEITKAKKKRSLDANSLCWVLCTQIAQAVGADKDEVYRDAIRQGNQYYQLQMLPEAVQAFTTAWQSKGIGWTAEVVDDAPNGQKLVFAYYGSSAYDTKQMSELINRLVDLAKSLDIEVMSERERSLLLEKWGKNE